MSMNNFLTAIEENKELIEAQVARFQGAAASGSPPAARDESLLDGVMAADFRRMREDLGGLEQAAAQLETLPAVPQIEDGSVLADPRPTL